MTCGCNKKVTLHHINEESEYPWGSFYLECNECGYEWVNSNVVQFNLAMERGCIAYVAP